MKEDTKKKKKLHNKVTFKDYNQHQMWLLPPSLGELLGPHHIARLVNDIIEGMDLEPILNTYEGGGASSYHPRMLLKALVYGYIKKCYSSRSIEEACKENIGFMWLCGMQQPDHNTLNRFRKHQMKDTVKTVFAHVLNHLIEQGHIRLNDYYIDGTKIESVANRYTYVWAKNVKRFKSGLLDKIAVLLDQIERTNEEAEGRVASTTKTSQSDEQQSATPIDTQSELAKSKEQKVDTSKSLKQTIKQLNKDLAAELTQNKSLKKKLEQLEKEHLPKLMEYEQHEILLNGRNSYSKTDMDATFMRTKDDHLGNGQLKPCYNWQFGTEDQFVVNYTVHQTPSDMVCFTDHMTDTFELLESIGAPKPKRATADAGYGSEENHEFLEQNEIEAYVKYPGYYKEDKKAKPKQVFQSSRLYYNEEQDCFICPMGQKMNYTSSFQQKTKTGFEQEIRCYEAQRCEGCPLRGTCFKSKEDNRRIKFNRNAYYHRKKAKQKLQSLRGIKLRKQRNVDVEPVFGHLKQCRGFRRCLLKGVQGVNIETGFLTIAHNLKKLHVKMQSPRISLPSPLKNPPNCAQIIPIYHQMELFEEKVRV